MNIEIYISRDGHVVLTCDGLFQETLEAVVLNPRTRLISLLFENDDTPAELNCALDEEIARHVESQEFCAVGFFEGARMAAAQYVPLRSENLSKGE